VESFQKYNVLVSDLSNIDQRLITSETIERLERIDHKFQVIKIESVDHQMVSERQLWMS
jgi:LysM repeat protein